MSIWLILLLYVIFAITHFLCLYLFIYINSDLFYDLYDIKQFRYRFFKKYTFKEKDI